jgi:hypothetical protein
VNELAPPLNLASGSMGATYNISVFSHLSEASHYAWRDELGRVTRPGGLLLVTLNGDAYREVLLPPERRTWDAGNLVVRSGVREGKKMFNAFHPLPFIRRLFDGFTVLERLAAPFPGTLQELWVFRTPA